MQQQLRKSGTDVLGDIPWGTHLCQFYETSKDLLDLLIPFFKAGLENNEFCLWITSYPLTPVDAIHGLEKAFPNLNYYLSCKSIEILSHDEGEPKDGKINIKDIVEIWNDKLGDALARGYEGMRMNSNASCFNEDDWKDFMEYEHRLDQELLGKNTIVLCAYPMTKLNGIAMLDVAYAHDYVIGRRNGKWQGLATASRTIHKLKHENAVLRKEIDERKNSELRISGEKELSKEIRESIPGIFELYNANFRLLQWNKQLETVTGYSPEEIRHLHVVKDLCGFEDQAEKFRIIDQIYNTGRYEGEVIIKTKAGDKIPFYYVGQLINYQGQQCVIATAVDITERKRIEEDLKISEFRYRSLVEQASDAIIISDENGDLLQANTSFCNLFGYAANELPRMNLSDLMDIVALKNDPLRYDLLLAGKTILRERRMKKKDGTIFEAEANVQMLPDKRILAIIRDITGRKQAEDALRLAYQYLSYHVENTPLAIIEWDNHLVIKKWSKRAEEIFGWTTSEAVGKYLFDINIIYAEDMEAVRVIADEVMHSQVTHTLHINRNYTKEGKVIYCEWYNSVLRDEQGNVITVLSLVQEVTERKKAEEALRKSYEEIRRLTEHLQEVREEERTRIAREIHDELGQHLTAIKMDIAWIDKNTPEEVADIKRKLKNVIGLLDGSNQSIRRILSELRPQILGDYGLPEAIEWLGRRVTETTGIPVKFRSPHRDIKLPEQIATNIFRICQEALTNIARHSHAKNILITIKLMEGKIILIIEDDGAGFDFASVQQTTSFGILGMRERVISLGGNFDLVSSPGKGTRITVSLPFNSNKDRPVSK